MKKLACRAVCLLAMATPAAAQQSKPSTHVLLAPADVTWGEPPPALSKGAGFAVVSGDPGKAGPFTIRLRLPLGYKVAPHWHPTDEHVTVLSGTFALGMGDKFDLTALKALPAGGYALLPAEMRHYAMATTAAIVQVHGTGPFVLNYVNPEDDPRKAAPAK